MKGPLFVIALGFALLLACTHLFAQEDATPPSNQVSETTTDQEPPLIRVDEEPLSAEEPFDEGLFEDVLPPQVAPHGGAQPAEKPLPVPEDDNGPRKLTIDAVVVVKYIFSSGTDSYSVKYHLNMGGDINGETSLIKGNAKVATDISGFLAKSSAFECLLKVSIADVPYEIMFKKVSDSEADIDVSFKGRLLEDWESICTFLDTSGAKFNTRGAPERWIGMALEKTKPPLNRITTPLDPKKATTSKFSIPKATIEDEGLGTVEIEGTGVITIEPVKKPVEPDLPTGHL